MRRPADVIGPSAAAQVSERELKTAQQLIRALATESVPEKHADASGIDGHASGVDELMAALRASVEDAKRRGSSNGYSSVTRRRGQRARGSA